MKPRLDRPAPYVLKPLKPCFGLQTILKLMGQISLSSLIALVLGI
jgi:hypothetical protein